MATKLKPINRRTSPRLPTMLKVDYTTGGDVHSNYSTNISENGIFLQARHAIEAGVRIQVRVRLPGYTKPIQALGKVMWVHKGGEANPVLPGIGVLFQYLSPEHRAQLDDFLQHYG